MAVRRLVNHPIAKKVTNITSRPSYFVKVFFALYYVLVIKQNHSVYSHIFETNFYIHILLFSFLLCRPVEEYPWLLKFRSMNLFVVFFFLLFIIKLQTFFIQTRFTYNIIKTIMNLQMAGRQMISYFCGKKAIRYRLLKIFIFHDSR